MRPPNIKQHRPATGTFENRNYFDDFNSGTTLSLTISNQIRFRVRTNLAKINENSRGSGTQPEYGRKSSTRHETPHFSHALHFVLTIIINVLVSIHGEIGMHRNVKQWVYCHPHTVLYVCVLYSTFCVNAVCCCTVCG
jgi:hypothetical protein